MLSEQSKCELKESIAKNHHEICILSLEQMSHMVRASNIHPESKKLWNDTLRAPAEFGASWYGSAKDTATLFKLVGELGGSHILGGALTLSSVKVYGGKPHLILKGNPAFRGLLKYSAYAVNDPVIVNLGIGKQAVLGGAFSGGILSILLISGFRVLDFFLNDEATLSYFFGSLATDIVKIGIATSASALAVRSLAEGVTLVIGPLTVFVFVGIVASWGLGKLDEYYKITDQLIAKIDQRIKDAADDLMDQQRSQQGAYQLRGIFG